jgi:hypothetical protein
MTAQCLAITLEKGLDMCRSFTEKNIFPYLTNEQKIQFWQTKKVTEGDWNQLVRNYLSHAFHHTILVSLEDNDLTGFHLEVQNPNFKRFLKDMFNGNVYDHLDQVRTIDPHMITENINPLKDVIFPDAILDKISSVNNTPGEPYELTGRVTRNMTLTKQKINRVIQEVSEENRDEVIAIDRKADYHSI